MQGIELFAVGSDDTSSDAVVLRSVCSCRDEVAVVGIDEHDKPTGRPCPRVIATRPDAAIALLGKLSTEEALHDCT